MLNASSREAAFSTDTEVVTLTATHHVNLITANLIAGGPPGGGCEICNGLVSDLELERKYSLSASGCNRDF